MIAAHVVRDQRFMAYDFGPGHPMHPIRLELTYRLSAELGLLDHENVDLREAQIADRAMLSTVHTDELIDLVQASSLDPGGANGHCGVGSADTPAFAGMHEASALAVGATVGACRAVWQGHAEHAVNIAGGLHHAMPGRVSGFCVYNDVAVGIQDLLAAGAKRVAYIDLDVHHGDGVEAAFWNDPRVMTVSVHQSGTSLFPGTGFPRDTGGPKALESAVNVALPPGTDDRGWLRAYQAVVPSVIEAFAPDIIVSQHGCDSHRSDPLAHLNLTIDGMHTAYEWVHELAHRVSGGRWVALGGGGYELVNVVPRAWAHLIGIASHRPVSLTEPTPQAWRDQVAALCSVEAPLAMGDRGGESISYGSWADGYHPEDEVDASIMATRTAVFPGLGLDPYFD